MAGIKKTTKANKNNKNVKTAKNSSREIARKEEKKAAAKKSTSAKSTSREATHKEEKKKTTSTKNFPGFIVLPTARESSKFINNGIMKRHNEAQQGMFRDKPESNGGVSYKDFVKDKKTYQFTPDRTAEVPVDNTPRYGKIGTQRFQIKKDEASKLTYKDNPLVGLGQTNSQTRMSPMQQQKYDIGKQEARTNIEYIKQNWNVLNDKDKQDFALYAVYSQGINDQTRDIFDDAYKNASGQNKINLLSAAVYYNGYNNDVNKYIKQLYPEEKKTLQKTLTASMYGEYNEENYNKGKADLKDYYDAVKQQKGNQFERDYAKEHGYGKFQYLSNKVLEAIGKTGAGINTYVGMTAADISKADRAVTAPWNGVDLLNNDPITNITSVAKNFANFALSGLEKAFKNDTKTFYRLTHGEKISEESLDEISKKIEKWGTHVSDDYWNDVYMTEAKASDAGISDNVKFAGQVIDALGTTIPAIIISLVNPAAGPAGLAALGTSAAGQYAKQAYDSGASLEDAVTYGTVMGVGEAATERMFTGFGYFGKGAVSTLGKRTGVQLLSPTTRQTLEFFGNSMGGRILKRLAAGGGEASEEALMELVEPFIRRATYDENAANATWQEIAAAGGLGFVVAEILGVPATALGVYSTKSGESKFLNQFKEGLKEGGLSEPEINTVMQQAKRVTKGKGTIASNESKAEEVSVTSNLSEVTNSVEEATAKLKEKAKNMEVGDVVSVAVVTNEGVKTLTATIRENGLLSMPTYTDTLDAKEYKYKAKQLENARNTAEKTGVQLNVSPSIIESVSAIENATGTEIVFEDNARKNENGRYENGKIYVNINSRNPVAQIVAHELTHTLSSTNSYSKLQELVFNYYKDSVGYKQDDVLELYESNGVKLNSIEDINDEVMAIFVEKKLLTDFDTIKTVTKDKSLARKIIDWLNNMIQKLTGTKEQKFFVDARNMYKKALTEKSGETKNGAKYSLAEADEKYLAAVESGDMETAQKMVDEAARKAGYTVKAHHGTEADFTVFDKNQMKESDPVTYDDNGNVIPLSERFNAKNEDIRYSISENERNPFEEELDGISAEGIFENYFKGKDGNIKYGGKKATDEVITAMRFASELTAGIENHFSVIDNKRKISNMIKNVAMNIYLGKGFTENDVIKITKAAYENSGENIEIEDSIKAAKKELRNLKIYIPKDVRGEVNDLGGIVALNKKGISNKTSFTFTKGNDSISLDDMRDILLNSYPDVFSDSLGVEEILQVISITPKKKMKIQGDEEALREGMTEQEMKEILENEISFVRKSLQYYSENVKNRIVNAANKKVERRYKKESKKLSEAAKKTAREFSRANKITNQRYKNISAYHAKKSEQLSEKERKIYEQAQEKAYRDKLEKRKKAVLEEASKKKVKSPSPEDTRKLLYQQNSEVQNLRRGFKKDVLFLLGDVEQKNSPKYVNVLLAEQEGIDKDTFYGIYADMKKIVADRKDDKVIMGSRRKKVIDYIQSLNLTAKQKKFLYLDIAGFKLSNIPTFKNGGTVKPLGNRKGRLDRAIEEMALDMYTGDFSENQIDDFLSIYFNEETTSEFTYDTLKAKISGYVLDYSQKIAQAKENARTKIQPSMGKEKRSIKELKKSGARELKKYLLDEGEAFTRMENALKYYNLYSYYNAAKQSNAIATTMLFEGGQYNFEGEYLGRSLYEIMEPILKKGDRILPGKEKDNSYLSAFEQYMFELHNMDRIIYEKPVTNSTLSESKKIVDDLLMQFPEFKGIGKEVHQFIRNLLDMSVSVGRITREDAEYFKEKYRHYVPTFRSEEAIDNDGRIRRVHKIFKTAEGGNQTLDPLWEQIERRTREIVKELKKNELAVHLMEAFFRNPEKAKEFISDVDTEYEDITSMEDVVDSFGYEEPKSKDSRPFIPAYVNGVRSNIYIADANILYAWDRISIHRDEVLFETILRNVNNFKRGTLTTYNPVFTLTNGLKDLQDMFIYNKHAEKLPYYFGKAWTGIIADNTKVAQEWKRYLANGAANASIFEYDNTVGGKKKNPSKLYDKTLKHIDDVNFLVEQAPRFAVYLETKDRLTRQNKKGLNQYTKRDIEMQAMLAAADATLNFGRSGTLVKYLNTYGVTFLNAGVQGMDRLVRTFKQTKGETNIQTALNVTGLVIKMALFGIAPSLANWLIYKDDDEYEDIPDYKKMANYIFKINGEWFMIPKGRVLAWLSSLFYIPYGYMKGDYSPVEALREELRVFTDNIAPSNPVTSNVLGVFGQMWANKDFFGYEIVPTWMKDKSGYLQYDEDTTELSKAITKFMHDITTDSEGNTLVDWSALKMDYMIDQMTGILGDTFLPLFKAGTFDGNAKDILKRAIKKLINPLEKKFTLDAVMTNESASEFYNLKDRLSRVIEDAGGNTPDAVALKYMNSRQDEIADLNNQIDDIYLDKGLSDKEKEDKILKLKDELNQLYKEIYVKTKQIRGEARSSYKAGGDIDQAYMAAIRKTQGTEYYIKNFGTEGEKNKWDEVKDSGINADTFLDAYKKINSFESDKDENGETINGSLRKKVVDYIESLDVTAEQKEALYKAQNYSEKTMPQFSDGGIMVSTAENEVSVSPLGGEFRVSSNFGYRQAPTAGASTYHQGIDLACKVGTPVVSLESGKVTKVKNGGGYGLEVEVTDDKGNVVKYAHLSAAGVKVGDTVSAGEQIAKSGNSGTSTGPHLHLGYMVDGQWVNPADYFGIDGARSGGYYNDKGYQDIVTASSNSSGRGSKKSSKTNISSTNIQSSAYNTVKNVAKTLSKEGYGSYTSVASTNEASASGKTNVKTSAPSNNYAYLPTAKTGATLPTAKGSTSTIKYNQKGTSTTATTRTSRPSFWHDSILS